VFQTVPHTLGLGPEVWRVLAKAHQRRNDAEYEGFVDVEERLVEDVIGAGRAVERALDALPAI
jgi:orotate phosphoribosyltransferase